MTATPEGWVDLGSPSPATVARAREWIETLDASGASHHGWGVAQEERGRGRIAEIGVWGWLRSLGVNFVADGGKGRPDLVIARRTVGVRCKGQNCHSRLHPNFDVVVHVDQSSDYHGLERLWVVHERPWDRYVIVGGTSMLKMKARGRLIRRGENRPGFGVARIEQYSLPLAELERPHEWLVAMMNRARATEAASATK